MSKTKWYQKPIYAMVVLALVLSLGIVAVPMAGTVEASPDTNVSGAISSDTTWGLAGSPYIVTGDVTVNAGVTLAINPGVTVKFNDNTGLICDGVLSAVGTESSRITFTTSRATPPAAVPYTVWNGIYLRGTGASGSHLEYCTVEYGITSKASIQVGSGTGDVDNVVISHCTLQKGGLPSLPWDPGVGIYLIGKHATVTYNDITECITGIEFECPNTTEDERSTFSHNDIHDVGSPTGQGMAIFFYSSGYCDIDYNMIHNTGQGIWHNSTGLGEGHINFRNNDISDGSGHGIQADGRVPYITIQDNIIDNCPGNANYRGIFVQGLDDTLADHIVVSGNTVRNNKWGLEVKPKGCTIEHNNFENITDGALMNSTGAQVTAQSNWWGDASGPNDPNDADGLPDNPTGTGCPLYPADDNIDYSNWLTTSWPPPSEVWVDDNWTGTTPGTEVEPGKIFGYNAFATIQDGINAVEGSTVHVAAGEYDEQVVINKNLTLQGAGDTTIIKPSSFDKLTNSYTVGSRTFHTFVVATTTGGSVTMKDFMVDGSSVTPPDNHRILGVHYRETGGVIDNVDVQHIRADNVNKGGNGILAFAESNAVTTEIKNCEVTDWDKGGIWAQGNKQIANIHDNIVTGRGSLTDEVQNAIQIAYGATGTVTNNQVSNVAYTGTGYWFAYGIIFGDASGTATGNTLTNCQAGIGAEAPLVNSHTVTISNNTISAAGLTGVPNVFGIYVCTWDANAAIGATIKDNDLSAGGPGKGIQIGDTATTPNGSPAGTVNATIGGNNLSNWQHGIWLGLTSNNVTINGNTITDNTAVGSGIHIEAAVNAANVSVNFNNIVGNEGYGVFNGGTGILDATNNWWKANDGPDDDAGVINGSGDKISTNVDADPWIQFTLAADPTEIVANGTSQSTLTAKLVQSDTGEIPSDINQLPEFDKVTFTTDKGTVGSSSVTKDLADGQATAKLTSSTTVQTATVTAQAKDASGNSISGATDDTTVNFTAGASSTVTLTANPDQITADGTSTSTLTATVKDQYGHPVADGTIVTFTTDHGTLSSPTATTASGVATVTLTSESSTETIIATVIAKAEGASGSAAVFFIGTGAPPVEVEESKTEEISGTGGTIPADESPTGGEVEVSGSGIPEGTAVTTAKYDGNPGGTPTFEATGDYYDVHLNSASGVNSLTVNFCPADEDTVIYYWTGISWRPCDIQQPSDGCIVVTITEDTHPSLSDLTGLPFAPGTPAPPAVGGEAFPPNKLAVLAPWIALLAAIIAGATIVLRRRRAQG